MLGVFSLPEPVTFRPGFLWGSATAGHQIEGGNIHSHKNFRNARAKPATSGNSTVRILICWRSWGIRPSVFRSNGPGSNRLRAFTMKRR